MKKTLLLVLIFTVTFAQAQFLTYSNLAPMPEARGGIDATAYNGKIYIENGYSTTGTNISNVLVYDIATNSYSTIGGFLPKRFANCEISGGKLYLFNGLLNDGSVNTSIEVYDLATSTLLTSIQNPYSSRNAGSVVNSNGDIYFFGGANQDEGIFYNRLVKFVPSTSQFTLMATMPAAMETKGEIVNNSLFVFGGYNGTSLNAVYEYNLVENWWATANFTVPNGISANGVATDGSRYFLTGDYANLTNNKIYEFENFQAYAIYDVTQSGFVGRRHHASVVVNDKLYVFGGNTAVATSSSLSSAQVANLPMNIGITTNAMNNFTYDYCMTTTNGINYFYGAGSTPVLYTFPECQVRFVKHNNSNINWSSSAFPMGTGVQNGANITILGGGSYYVYFNRITGAYQFSTTLLSNEAINKEQQLSFYPNPADDKVIFSEEIKTIAVYDMLGKERKVILNKNEVSLSGLSIGTYIMKVTTLDGNSFTKEIIKK